MTQRHAKVLTVHRRYVKKPILLISGCEHFSTMNIILTLFQQVKGMENPGSRVSFN
jgi:hypothetical protein